MPNVVTVKMEAYCGQSHCNTACWKCMYIRHYAWAITYTRS